MRRIAVFGVVAAVAVAVLTGCTTGPNQEAVKAAAEYGEKLTTWAEGLETALPKARTATPAEREDKGPDFTEVGLGDALTAPPTLKKFDDVKNTPTYLAAAKIATQVDAATTELEALEPESLKTLRGIGGDAYTIVADLYYDSLDVDSARLDAFIAARTFEDDSPEYAAAIRDGWKGFFVGRGDLVTKAAAAAKALKVDHPLGTSIAAFMADWYEEEVAFDEKAVETISANTAFADAYAGYWGVGNLNSLLDFAPRNAATLRTAYVGQIADLADALTTTGASAAPTTPAIGDPYRQLLLDGYLPSGDPGATTENATDRLWALWHIRELEGTPDEPYEAARVALYEEINRGLDPNQRVDFRPGADRLLQVITQYSDAFDYFDFDEGTVTTLKEITAFGKVLRDLPTLPAVAADFDTVLALYDELNAKLEDALTAYDDEYDRLTVLRGMQVEYETKVTDAATPSLTLVDDDAAFEALLADLIAATKPGAKTASAKSPTPSHSESEPSVSPSQEP